MNSQHPPIQNRNIYVRLLVDTHKEKFTIQTRFWPFHIRYSSSWWHKNVGSFYTNYSGVIICNLKAFGQKARIMTQWKSLIWAECSQNLPKDQIYWINFLVMVMRHMCFHNAHVKILVVY